MRVDVEVSTLTSVVAMPHPAPLAHGSHVETDATVLTSCVTPINIKIAVNLCSQLDYSGTNDGVRLWVDLRTSEEGLAVGRGPSPQRGWYFQSQSRCKEV